MAEQLSACSASRLDSLIESVYQGPLEAVPWKSFLHDFREALGSSAVTLILRPPTKEDAGLLLTEGLASEDWTRSYQAHHFALDPFVDLPTGEVMTLDELVPREVLIQGDFFKYFLEPVDVHHVIGFDTRDDDGVEARLRAARRRSDPAFGTPEKKLCKRLVPHLRRAVQIHARLNRVESERDLFADAIDHLAIGAIVLDEYARVLHCNHAAERLLGQGLGLAVAEGRLCASQHAETRMLRALVERVLHERGLGRASLVHGLCLHGSSGNSQLNLVIRPVPLAEWSEGRACPAVAIFVGNPDESPRVPCRLLRELFGLTRAEALLATTLAAGLSLDEASRELEVSRNTARAHLRAIFSKTGVTRQADLVRLILRSAASLA
jgi:DNA-binding CsgD family transcriptional regulator/PAS domain-containing protein